MPLVSPNNDGIDIPFTSSADQLVAESKRAVSEIDKVKDATRQKGKELEEQAKREQEAVKKSSNSWTEFRSMYSTVLDVVKVGQAVWAETGQKFIDNTIAMGDFSRSIGTTIEEAARLKEVAEM
jgi:DNA topoisomerase VI subunit B